MFSFVYWPFSIKLLWAPLVDSLYVSWFGRRKTWLIPTQYLIGLFMMVLSYRIKDIMGQASVDVFFLTVIFFMLNFLAATQDIAVDGWALTMLSRQNVGWASTCNTVGQTAGYFLGNVLFLALESADFCNNYLRWVPQKEGIVTLGKRVDPDVDPEQGIVDTYKTLLNVIRLPSVMSYALILLTAKVFVYMVFVAQMAFHAKISDPIIGGTYMTLLNTVANLGLEDDAVNACFR
nr:hypothetical protein BaRGS_033500 [Batillaria attramentaria]